MSLAFAAFKIQDLAPVYYRSRDWVQKHAKNAIASIAYDFNGDAFLSVFTVLRLHGAYKIIQVVVYSWLDENRVQAHDSKEWYHVHHALCILNY